LSINWRNMREALGTLDPAPAHDATTPPDLKQIYTPPGHEAALDPHRPLVVGGRGTGKSFWAAALLDPSARNFVSQIYRRLHLTKINVSLGFAGLDVEGGGPPSREVLDELISHGHKAEVIWRAVFLRAVAGEADLALPTTWRRLVEWCGEDAERVQEALRRADRKLAANSKIQIVIFDALDRLGENWADIRERTKALLRVALALRTYKAIKPKIFMRTDQAEDQSLAAFPDASKLLGSKVDLYWERRDLYGLLFTYLANDPRSRNDFQKLVRQRTPFKLELGGTYQLPSELKEDELGQEQLFIGVAGPYMGVDKRRGRTYSWIHNHLSDAFGRVSPRTFLMAFRAAAQSSRSVEDKVVDTRGLQVGLQVASEHRLVQLREEFAWISAALEPLADLRVPCEEDALFSRWKTARTVEVIRSAARAEGFLEPVEFDIGGVNPLAALLQALARIGVAERRADDRVNVPDIYRVAAKLLRKGGVPPRKAA
jgi:hypothetical protein